MANKGQWTRSVRIKKKVIGCTSEPTIALLSLKLHRRGPQQPQRRDEPRKGPYEVGCQLSLLQKEVMVRNASTWKIVKMLVTPTTGRTASKRWRCGYYDDTRMEAMQNSSRRRAKDLCRGHPHLQTRLCLAYNMTGHKFWDRMAPLLSPRPMVTPYQISTSVLHHKYGDAPQIMKCGHKNYPSFCTM